MKDFYEEKLYAYANGRIRKLEDRLLDEGVYTRMADAQTFEQAFTVLNETSYVEHMSKLKSAFDLEELVELELLSTKKLFDHFAPYNNVIRALWFKYDIINIKTLIKAKAAKLSDIKLNDLGILDKNKLKNFIFDGIDEIDREIKEQILKASAAFRDSSDIQLIDIILDNYYYSQLLKAANESGVPLFQRIAKSMIDITNIKTFIRAKSLKKDREVFEKLLILGGSLHHAELIELYAREIDDLSIRLKYTPYHRIIDEGIEYFKKNRSLFHFEKLADDFIMLIIKSVKTIAFGIEPLIAFFIAKETEAKNLRLVLICKKNNLKNEEIKERLRAAYV